MTNRWDETWHRLRDWTNGQGPSERLAAQILYAEGFKDVDPNHPLGGRDGGGDALCTKDGKTWVMAAYFPRGQKEFREVRAKFVEDAKKAEKLGMSGIAFVTNQELRLAERAELKARIHSDIFHLERVAGILDRPDMLSIRKQFLGVDNLQAGAGGRGGNATVAGKNSGAIGGTGGVGGVGPGGDGGNAAVLGDNSFARGGDGGNAGQHDGRGGRRTLSQGERLNLATAMWPYGYGGAGANAPEYDRRLLLLAQIRREYITAFPGDAIFVESGVDLVPPRWVNKRLEEMNEDWRIEIDSLDGGYKMPPLKE